jgi:hypothetical protein
MQLATTSQLLQYGMYGFFAALLVIAMAFAVIPTTYGLPLLSLIIGTAIGWHIPTPATPIDIEPHPPLSQEGDHHT